MLELEPRQREIYDRLREEGIFELREQGESIRVQHVLALITKLKQVCNMVELPVAGSRMDSQASIESCKLDYLVEKLETIREEGSKALVFSQFPEATLKKLVPHLSVYNPLLYHGGLPDRQREEVLRCFKEDDSHTVLLISTKAGGLGLNLTEANYVFHFDLWWNPATSAQAEDRVHRIGQKKSVIVQSLLTVDTIEERIQAILERKGLLFKDVIDDLSESDVQKGLTEEELFGLFGLKKPSARKPDANGASDLEGQLQSLTPYAFERLVQRLYQAMGYRVDLTPRSRDEGVDLYATRSTDSGTERLAIQCKHYPTALVGTPILRELLGVLQAKHDISRAVLVTSGGFSSDCCHFVDQHRRIQLLDKSRLLGLLTKYRVGMQDDRFR